MKPNKNEYIDQTSITIEASPQQVYDFVLTPRNWKGTHPVTADVAGNVDEVVTIGSSWREFIDFPPHKVIATWTCNKAEPAKMAEYFSLEPYAPNACYITYEFQPSGGGTQFTRTMRVPFTDSPAPAENQNTAEVSKKYLEAVKSAVESANKK
ncbi:SRPBCC family protein [Bacillus cereus]|uniref:SRPBCC family protein n=1 Tax=Bacillus cereus TaxID=1396 RepID=UPI0024BCFB42|nr:SRPBCC family protein [Bacillus cereus]